MSSNNNSSYLNALKTSVELYSHNRSTSVDSVKGMCPFISSKLLKKINHLKTSSNLANRAKKGNDTLKSFHTNMLRDNIHSSKEYLSLIKNTSIKETNLPELIIKTKINNSQNSTDINANTFSSLNKTNNYGKYIKYNKSNINTSTNISSLLEQIPLKSSKKLSKNSTSLFKSQNMTQTQYNINKNLESYDNSVSDNVNEEDVEYIYELNKNKNFKVEINPLYSKLKTEFLSEFVRKVRNLAYEKYNLYLRKKEVLNEKERQKTEIEQENLNFHKYNHMLNLFTSYNDLSIQYFVHMIKQISNDKKINDELIEKKIALMNEIYALRYKILRLENKFHHYLNDKYFLLSVKNHSIELEKFCEADKQDYSNDLKKLEILNLILAKTANQSQNDPSDENASKNSHNVKNPRKSISIQAKKNHENSRFDPKYIRDFNFKNRSDKKFTSTRRTIRKKKVIDDTPYLLTTTQKKLITTNFKATPTYEDPADFNRDLEQTKRNIQYSLIEYNKLTKEIHSLIDELVQTKIEVKNIENLYKYFQKEIKEAEIKLEKVKLQHLNMKKLRDHIWIVANTNLNKGKVNKKLKEILNNIYKVGDDKIKEFLKTPKFNELLKIKILESLVNYLIEYKEKQKVENPIAFSNVIKKINAYNRLKIFQNQLKTTEEKFQNKINRVINKDNKVCYVNYRKPNYGVNRLKTYHKDKIIKKTKIDIFDFDII